MALATLPPQFYLGWKVSMSLLHVLAIISTIYRLVHRFRIHRTWWDDYIVFIPLVLDIAYWPLFWFRFDHRMNLRNPSLTYQILSSYWLSLLPYLIIVWSTRIVLALSLVRLFPQKHPARLWSFFLIAFMVLSWITCILVTIMSCKHSSALLLIVNVKGDCIKGIGGFPVQDVFIFSVDFLGDMLLIISPLVFFWRVKLPRKERTLILMVFCGSSLTLLSAIAFIVLTNNHKISLGEDMTLVIAGLQNIEVAVSLFVCNLAIVSTCLYQALLRLCHQERPELETTEETPRDPSGECTCFFHQSPTPLTLTEISSFSQSSQFHPQ